MTNKLSWLCCCIVFLCMPAASLADQADQSPNEQDVVYHTYSVVHVAAPYYCVTTLTFLPKDTIKSVHIGDASSWQIAESQQHAYQLYLKPTAEVADTNMVIETQQHDYHVLLHASHVACQKVMHVVWHEGQHNISRHPIKKSRRFFRQNNKPVCFQGDASLLPLWAQDTGSALRIHRRPQQLFPNIMVSGDVRKGFQLVNFRVLGHDIVVRSSSPYVRLRVNQREAMLLRHCDSVRGD